MNNLHTLPAGHSLTIRADGANCYIRQVENPAIGGIVTDTQVFGPYALERHFETSGQVVVEIAEADFSANVPSATQAAMLDAIPAEDQEDGETVWNDEGTLKVSGAP